MSRYWEKRQARDAERAYRDAQTVTREIAALYQHGQIEILDIGKRIRQRFRAAYQLDKDQADALLSSPAGREEYEALLAEIAKLGRKNPKRDELLAKAAAPAYAHRISMAQTMEAELEALTARLCEQEETLVSRHLAKTAREQSLLAGFRIQQQAGVGFKFGGVSDALARQMIHEPWSGLDFSARIWMNQDALSELLNTTLREALTLGISGEKTAERIAEAMTVPMHRARTLVRTETTYVCNQADLAAYEEAEIDEYRFHATLDMRTSPACRKLDGKTFKRKDAQPGVNFPPMHPNCRSGTVQAFTQEELGRMERRARDPVTGKAVKVPASMTYEQWLNLQKETYGEERIEAAQKMAANRGKDQKQFEKYKELLGKKHLPPTLEKFQILKYTEKEEWEKTKRAFKTMNEVKGKDWADTFKEKARDTFWTAYAEGVEISSHGLARYMNRRDKVTGGYSLEQLIQNAKKPANYIQDDGRPIHFYDGAALVFSVKTNELVSFVPRKNPKKEWEKVNETAF